MSVDMVTQEASVVVVGSFNPMIFNPDWFIRHGLMSPSDMDENQIEIIHREISKFSMGWLSVEIVNNRFLARTNDASSFLPLRDLVVSIFSILSETPVTGLGMNKIFNFSFRDEDIWHKLGDVLAPKGIWHTVLPERVGLSSLKVESPRKDDLNGKIHVTVESFRSDEIKNGVRLNVNNHIDLAEELNIQTILQENWEPSLNLADDISQKIIKGAIS